jgi:hypothetical protein
LTTCPDGYVITYSISLSLSFLSFWRNRFVI